MIKAWIKSLKLINRSRKVRSKSRKLRSQLAPVVLHIERAIKEAQGKIPVIVVSYNNGVYVKNMVSQLQRFEIKPIIIDNCSCDTETIQILNAIKQSNTAHVVACHKNFGHMVGFLAPIYEVLPEVFAYTDPDIEFCSKMPHSFLSDLSSLTVKYSAFKAGLALSLSADDSLSCTTNRLSSTEPIYINKSFSIKEGEAPFWLRRLVHDSLEVYAAKIDTIFAVYRKSNYFGDFFDGVRIAGDYSAVHLPWFPKLDPMSVDQRMRYLNGNVSTTWL